MQSPTTSTIRTNIPVTQGKRRGKFSRICAHLFALFLFLSTPFATAQWSTDPNLNNPICTATGNQQYPRSISDGAGGAIITWEEFRNGTSDIYAQRINASGVVQWTSNGIPICTAPNNQSSPTLITDNSGGAIITWSDNRSGTNDIYAQRVNATGFVLWVADGVPICSAMEDQSYPAITSDNTSGAIITWRDYRTTNAHIYAQRINAGGIIQWTADGISVCTAPNDQYFPTITKDDVGGAIITWWDYRSGTNFDVYAQRINATGVVLWTANGIPICTTANDQIGPTITSDNLGGAIITWHDNRSGTDYDAYAQRINANGVAQWTANGVAVCTMANNQSQVIATSDNTGGAIILWGDYRSGTNWDIYAQRINATGVVQWTANGVAIFSVANDQYVSSVISDNAGGAIITWYDYRSGNYDIYAQRINASGVVLWTANGVAICTAANNQYYPTIVSDNSNGAIVSWQDFRSGTNYDIYAQKIDRNGNLGYGPTSKLTIASINPGSGVYVAITPNDSAGFGGGYTPFTYTYNTNTLVTLNASRFYGSNYFQKWQKDGVDFSTSQTTSLTMDANHSMTAVYALPAIIGVTPSTLSFTLAPSGTTSTTLSIQNTAVGGAQVLNWNMVESPASSANTAQQVITDTLTIKGFHNGFSNLQSAQKRSSTLPDKQVKDEHKQLPASPDLYQLAKEYSGVLGIRSVLFSDNMEGGINGWTTQLYGGAADNLWHQTTRSAHSPTKSWWCGIEASGDYNTGNRINIAAVSPSINLAGATAPVSLEFFEKYTTEADWDYCRLDVTTDNGTTWQPLRGTSSRAGTGSAPSGSSGGWVIASLDLTPYIGAQVKLRFYFDTNDGTFNTLEGWFVDDVKVYSGEVLTWDGESPLTGSVNAGASQTININVSAIGSSPGIYAGSLLVRSNDPIRPLTFIPVALTVSNQLTWEAFMSVRDTCNHLDTLHFGTGPTATDGLDAGLGEVELAPVPVTGVFDARFVLPVSPSVASRKDYRNDTLQNISWRMTFQSGCSVPPGYPMIISWNNTSFPANSSFYLRDEVTGTIVNVDMKAQTSYTLTNSGISALRIVYSKGIYKDVVANAGWNMISVPVNTTDMRKAILFPTANSAAYGFNNGYFTADTLRAGQGYWLKFGSATTVTLFGSRVDNRSIQVKSGWNMVGPLEFDVAVSTIGSTPAGIIASPFYGYANGYSNATTLLSGKGYWVKVSQNGTLDLPNSQAMPSAREENQSWTELAFTDNTGQQGKLYLASADQVARNYELPPYPPTGIFDVRFSSGANVEAVGKQLHEIQLKTTEYPITLTVRDLHGMVLRVRDAINGKLLDQLVTEGQPISLRNNLSTIQIVEENVAGNGLPKKFAMEQNYPNPFNPTTIIKFALPKDSRVNISVYNVLGEKVRELVNGDLDAGYHQIELDARDISSGMYFYKLETRGFVQSKKMLLLK